MLTLSGADTSSEGATVASVLASALLSDLPLRLRMAATPWLPLPPRHHEASIHEPVPCRSRRDTHNAGRSSYRAGGSVGVGKLFYVNGTLGTPKGALRGLVPTGGARGNLRHHAQRPADATDRCIAGVRGIDAGGCGSYLT